MPKRYAMKRELLDAGALDGRLYECLLRGCMPEYFACLIRSQRRRDAATSASPGLTDLLKQCLPRLVELFPRPFSFISIGAGAGKKERMVLESFPPSAISLYVPFDTSGAQVDCALAEAALLPVRTMGAVGMIEDFPRLAHDWDRPLVLAVLGNAISTCRPDYLFDHVSAVMGPLDTLVFDCIVTGKEEGPHAEPAFERKAPDERDRLCLEPLVERGLDLNRCAVALDRMEAQSLVGPVWQTRKAVRVEKPFSASFSRGSITIKAGRTFEMGVTYTYTEQQIQALMQRFGFRLREVCTDRTQTHMLAIATRRE